MFASRNRLLENKRTNAGLLSRFSFWYLADFFALGWSRSIKFSDCWEPSDDDLAASLIGPLEAQWNVELENKEQPSLSRAVFSANRKLLLLAPIFSFLLLSTRLAVPFITRELLRWFEPGVSVETINLKGGESLILAISSQFSQTSLSSP